MQIMAILGQQSQNRSRLAANVRHLPRFGQRTTSHHRRNRRQNQDDSHLTGAAALAADDKRSGLLQILADADAAVAMHSPCCDASGRCCRFADFGHTLFLTQMESELLFERPFDPNWQYDEGNCPYQVGGLCAARERRPFGCRVYFCDPDFATHMSEISEEFISRFKRLHVALGIGWSYRPLHHWIADWLAMQPADRSVAGGSVDSLSNPVNPVAESRPNDPLLPIIR